MIRGVQPKTIYLPQGWEFSSIGSCPFGGGEICATFNYVVKNPNGTRNNRIKPVLPDIVAYTSKELTAIAACEFDYQRGNIPMAEVNKAIGAFTYRDVMENISAAAERWEAEKLKAGDLRLAA